MKALSYSIYMQLAMFLRIKAALFFSLVFPILLYLVFGSLWGSADDKSYYYFLFTGIIAMNAMSEGLFVIGPVVKEYYANGVLKFFKKINTDKQVINLFLSVIVARLAILFLGILILNLCSIVFFDFSIEINNLLKLVPAVTIGFFIFSFLGLSLSFFSLSTNNGSGANYTNIIYYIALFTSNAFYPADQLNKIVSFIGNLFPLNSMLSFVRDSSNNPVSLLIWLVISFTVFIVLVKRVKFKR